jgi:hypothetical protein
LGLLQCAGLLTRGGIHAVKETRHIHDVTRQIDAAFSQGIERAAFRRDGFGCDDAGRLVHVFTSGDKTRA